MLGRMKGRVWVGLALALLVGGLALGIAKAPWMHLGKQEDGSFMVSSGQHIQGDAVAFRGRPSDFAMHPNGQFFAVLNQDDVFLLSPTGELARTRVALSDHREVAGFHGILWDYDQRGVNWTPDGMRFLCTTADGYVQEVLYEDKILYLKERISLVPEGSKRNAVPGGMALTKDHKTVFVAAAGLDAVVAVDIQSHRRIRAYPVEALPYEVALSGDEQTLIVSNWGGRKARPGDLTAKSVDEDIVTDERGAPSTGTVSLVDRPSGTVTNLAVGVHPTAIAVSGNRAYVANAMSDSISEIDIPGKRVLRTIPIRYGNLNVVGAMPNALAIRGNTLYVADGGDNALVEIDLGSGSVRGFRHAGYYPCAVQLSADGKTAYVLNSKGNGSVMNTSVGNAGNPHDFQGSMSVIDLTKDLKAETALVAKDNRWDFDYAHYRPNLAVYNGAIKHVVYIIKENQTYDSIFGDMKEGNGDASLCVMGETVMPNHRKLAREFGLFDNFYVSGTNSADGHAWCTQAMANDYLEHFYVGYSRTYPDDGDCAMSISTGGCLWDKALEKHKSVRVYGEFCDDDIAEYSPYRPKDWFEAYEDYKSGKHKFRYTAHTLVNSLKPYICPTVHYWPLLQCDQDRADEFIKEWNAYSGNDTVPDLLILCLPCDHGSGVDPNYPTIRAMQADNDLALGRVIETISHSPQWKDTCVFVTEDDGQAEPDHVDGHRTVLLTISPYAKREPNHTFATQTNMLHSIELMLGLDPMTRFDAVAGPMEDMFTDTPNLTPYSHTPNNVALDERNPTGSAMTADDRYWLALSRSLDWSHIDGPDARLLSRVHWHSLTGGRREYPKGY
jgi:DNA-binding beta-propeller fold protein YncE